MQPKGSDSSRRGFGGLTAGRFADKHAPLRVSDERTRAIRRRAPQHDDDTEPGEGGYRGSGRLLGRKALVTGGEGGVGRAAAIAFAREGADVAFNFPAQARPEAEQVARLIRQAGRKAVALAGDLRDEAFCSRLVVAAVRELGGLDVLVSNAPEHCAMADIAEMSTDQFDATFRTNIYAMFWLTKAALPHLGPGASIINTSSIDQYDPAAILLDYAATKGAIMVFTKSLAKQLASRGIRVNAVAPGPLWTPRSGGELPLDASRDEEQPEIGAARRVARVQSAQLASICVLLASNESSYSTGQLYGAVG